MYESNEKNTVIIKQQLFTNSLCASKDAYPNAAEGGALPTWGKDFYIQISLYKEYGDVQIVWVGFPSLKNIYSTVKMEVPIVHEACTLHARRTHVPRTMTKVERTMILGNVQQHKVFFLTAFGR